MGKKRILVTCGKFISTLDIVRKLRNAGHEVFVADTSWWQICRFSNAVSKSYVIPSPRFKTEKSIQALVNIIEEQKIDCLLPTCEETLYIAQHIDRFPCEVFCSSFETVHCLHNKWHFNQMQKSHGLAVPESYLIRSPEELQKVPLKVPYALKAVYSRASQRVFCVKDLDDPPKIQIEPHNPWLAQEWLHGEKFCTYSICRDGVVTAHVTYPITFSKKGQFCVYYESIDHPEILRWTQEFVAKENFTGQLGIDFIQPAHGEIYAIECNPRSTFALELFTAEQFNDALFGKPSGPHIPAFGTTAQTAPGMLLFAWGSQSARKIFKALFTTRDPIYEAKDLKPLMMTIPLFGYQLAMMARYRESLISAYFHDVNWDGKGDKPYIEERLENAS